MEERIKNYYAMKVETNSLFETDRTESNRLYNEIRLEEVRIIDELRKIYMFERNYYDEDIIPENTYKFERRLFSNSLETLLNLKTIKDTSNTIYIYAHEGRYFFHYAYYKFAPTRSFIVDMKENKSIEVGLYEINRIAGRYNENAMDILMSGEYKSILGIIH